MTLPTYQRRMKILAVDDEKFNRQVLTDLLKDDYELVLAKNAAQTFERVREHRPDLILLDLVMPEMDGYEVLKILKSDETTSDISVIVISGLASAIDEAKGLALGALDYITKPFHPTIVKARVRNVMEMVRHRKMVEYLANVDALTGINNRRKFDNTLLAEWRSAARRKAPLTLAMIDIDCFKQYNDRFGHIQGDEVLRKVAQAIVSCLRRPHDFGARYGGEEFVVLLPDTNSDGARTVLENMRQAVEDLDISHDTSCVAERVTISVGGATVIPFDEEDPRSLMHASDRMLYQAKKEGRNRVACDIPQLKSMERNTG